MTDRVLVTGASGFIAKHVIAELLSSGFEVRGSLRTMDRADEVRAAAAKAGADPAGLSFVEADLGDDRGWAEAAAGCRFVQHLASPFPMEQPRDREALVPVTREGALRVLKAALDAGAERVVLTSSMVAMMYRGGQPAELRVGEGSWSDPEWPPATAYIVSKTRAERAAWDLAAERGATDRLVTVNPGVVLGPVLDTAGGTSVGVVRLLLEGAYPAVPPVAWPVVDVRDVAALHVAAMTAEVGGRRLIAAGGTMSMAEIGRELRDAFPERARKVPVRTLPAPVVRLLAFFDRSLRSVTPNLGFRPVADTAYVAERTGVTFRPPTEAVRATARSLIELGLA
ncbi:MAG: NAD-dependent epimerase/dehydratase family protein [Thermoanaerobaculales bacterium]|jgi:dihydroflavonol-4-reductase|nr:NAD-dependent epimerase/dehydratase family protein [Thermoanaerobaculales bacterium]